MSRPLIDSYAGVVCDLDGVVYRGPQPVPHAVEALTGCPVRVIYATNNASRPPALVAEHLRELGLTADDIDVATSAQAGARHVADLLGTGAAVLAVGGPGVAEALREAGLRPVTALEDPVGAVLQGYGPQVTAADLAEAAYAVQAGAEWVATNGDATLPTERGLAPGNGALVAAVGLAVSGAPTVVGKPHPPLYLLCADRLGVTPARLLAVGDRLDTDIAGAVQAGMDSALVLTGVDSPGRVALAPPQMRPRYVLADLRGLHTAYQPATLADGWWTCGQESGRVHRGRWQSDGAGDAVQQARVVIAAVSSALDDGALTRADAEALVSQIHWRQ